MKPFLDSFCVVTASCDLARAEDCLASWRDHAAYDWRHFEYVNNAEAGGYAGVVPAFAAVVGAALAATKAGIICCLHDDVLIEEDGWDARVITHFATHPACGLAGFGGATALGAPDIYQTPYDPMQLARQDFVSNMREAAKHGRVGGAQRVACLDGFSQIGRRAFWQGMPPNMPPDTPKSIWNGWQAFQFLADLGIAHHAYDGALGCLAKRLGWEAWMIPVACHHFGGRTAVADQGYHAWADQQTGQPGEGDLMFWHAAHRIVYDEFKDVLPFAVFSVR